MIRRFTSSMYQKLHEEGEGNPINPYEEQNEHEELVDDPEEQTDALPEEDYQILNLIDATNVDDMPVM